MQTVDVQSWKNVSDTIFVPHTEAEYERLVEMLDNLIDQGRRRQNASTCLFNGRIVSID